MAFTDPEVPDVFRVTSAGGAGLTRRQTQAAAFVTSSPGVRIRAAAVGDAEARLAAATTGCRQDVVLTDLSAARAWGLPLPWWAESRDRPLSLSVSADSARPRRADVRGRRLRLPPDHVTQLRGHRITTPARTWLDCAAALPLGHLVAMGDTVLRRNLASAEELELVCHWAFRRRGVAVARKARAMLDPGAESPGESRARVVLLVGGVPAPECNADVIHLGEWLARADMLWRRQRVIVEYDGAVHLAEEQRRRDAVRRNLLQSAGWFVIVFTARDLRHPEQMCRLVKDALNRGNSTRS